MRHFAAAGAVFIATSAPAATLYFDEASYLSALSAVVGVNSVVHENFEGDAVWGATRSSHLGFSSTPSVVSKGIEYTANHSQNFVATSNGAAYRGQWGMFSYHHGDATDSVGLGCHSIDEPAPDSACWLEDGWIMSAAGGETLYGFGGYIDTNTGGGAKITFLLDGVDVSAELPDNPDNINRDGFALPYYPDPNPGFFGVIDVAGFSSIEVRELAGKDDQQEFIFGDDFTFGSSALPGPVSAVPLPASGLLLLAGLGALGLRGRKRR